MFTDADTNEHGNLSATEAENLAGDYQGGIDNATGFTMTASDSTAGYDANGDGVLSEEETALLAAGKEPPHGGSPGWIIVRFA